MGFPELPCQSMNMDYQTVHFNCDDAVAAKVDARSQVDRNPEARRAWLQGMEMGVEHAVPGFAC